MTILKTIYGETKKRNVRAIIIHPISLTSSLVHSIWFYVLLWCILEIYILVKTSSQLDIFLSFLARRPYHGFYTILYSLSLSLFVFFSLSLDYRTSEFSQTQRITQDMFVAYVVPFSSRCSPISFWHALAPLFSAVPPPKLNRSCKAPLITQRRELNVRNFFSAVFCPLDCKSMLCQSEPKARTGDEVDKAMPCARF